MKLRLSLFLFLACSLLAGTATAQCSTAPRAFPIRQNPDIMLPFGTFCIANAEVGGVQGGRLRWGTGGLELFDTDDGGKLLWCAGGGRNPNPINCTRGNTLCLQQDGNMVIYANQGTNLAKVCDNGATDHGVAVWASNTQGKNDDHEVLGVLDNSTDEHAFIQNRSGIVWIR